MSKNLTQKLIESHLAEGQLEPGEPIALRIDQTLTQDATGTLVMLEFEQFDLPRVQTELSAQYVDHNLIQEDHKNPDDHRFLRSACRKFGVHYSRPGNGVSHPVHMERFGIPGKTLLGSDSHTPAAGCLGMLAIGAGGVAVALAMAGEPYHLTMPKIRGIRLSGKLRDWVSAKDVILELLRRHGVSGAKGHILEFFGPGLGGLTAMDRHVIANMGTELGATSTVFPSDEAVRGFLKSQARESDWSKWAADPKCTYDLEEEIDLTSLEPLIACPSSPGNVVPVREIAGKPIGQAYIGSSANPGYRDFAIAAEIVRGRSVPPEISFDINPSSRQILQDLTENHHLGSLIQAGARLHQAGCNGCIGMGQAPATDSISLRTVPRNFPGRSGTREDNVYLCSPETAAASALTGRITDPTTLEQPYPRNLEPDSPSVDAAMIEPPPENAEGELIKGPNVVTLPAFEQLPDALEAPVILKVGDDISTDEILPAGADVLPYRSNIPEISSFVFRDVDEDFQKRAAENENFFVAGGENYGQGSSREHAALAPRYLGLRAVFAKSLARIHRQNLIHFGVLPIQLDPEIIDSIHQGSTVRLENLDDLESPIRLTLDGRTSEIDLHLDAHERAVLEQGGILNWAQQNLHHQAA